MIILNRYKSLLAGCLVAAAVGSTASDAAYVEFAYIGKTFADFSAPYDVSDGITARFVLDLPSVVNLPLGSYFPDLRDGRLLMSDGVRVESVPGGNAQAFPTVLLSTGADGVPTDWKVAIDTVDASQGIFTESYDCVFSDLGPACDFTSAANTPLAWVSDDLGEWTVSTFVPGDFNRDGAVDAADFTVWRDSVGETGGLLDADHDLNGVVDAGDYQLWRANFGAAAASAATAAPSPGSAALLFVGLGFAIARRPVTPRSMIVSEPTS
ncbi:MAG: hypothetical protein AAGJ46_13065 [Planctomycetota bacterium]